MGILSVLYARAVNSVQHFYFKQFEFSPYLVSFLTPILFVCSSFVVMRLAPEAKGSGIPQVLEAIENSKEGIATEKSRRLVSIRTATIKVISTLIGVLGGASVGREGPTVQIASSTFAWIARKTQRFTTEVEYSSYLIAGGAAGVAAAFNTPLAGIAFALEEIAETNFAQFKRLVMLSVIVAGITAQAIVGDYLYFGHMPNSHSSWIIVPEALLIGLIGGLAGGLFSLILAKINPKVLPGIWWKRALLCGVVCAVINFFSQGQTAGSGYEATRSFMDSADGYLPLLFPLEKFVTTLLSYASGMAGGIFSPCLSIGSGIGYLVGFASHFENVKVCALIGMVAFFSGVVQAPLTAVIIVMEMTDEHILILPFMIAAFLAHGMGKLFMPTPLYRFLASEKK